MSGWWTQAVLCIGCGCQWWRTRGCDLVRLSLLDMIARFQWDSYRRKLFALWRAWIHSCRLHSRGCTAPTRNVMLKNHAYHSFSVMVRTWISRKIFEPQALLTQENTVKESMVSLDSAVLVPAQSIIWAILSKHWCIFQQKSLWIFKVSYPMKRSKTMKAILASARDYLAFSWITVWKQKEKPWMLQIHL